MTKNHQGTTNETEGTGGRMYATDSVLCPVKSFEKYLSKRHAGTDRLFLHSKITSRIMTQCGTEQVNENYFEVSWFI